MFGNLRPAKKREGPITYKQRNSISARSFPMQIPAFLLVVGNKHFSHVTCMLEICLNIDLITTMGPVDERIAWINLISRKLDFFFIFLKHVPAVGFHEAAASGLSLASARRVTGAGIANQDARACATHSSDVACHVCV
jgi:hypothetical protein